MRQTKLSYDRLDMRPIRGIDRIPHVVTLPSEGADLMRIEGYKDVRKQGIVRALDARQAVWLFITRSNYRITREVYHALQQRGEGLDKYAFPLPSLSCENGSEINAGDSNYPLIMRYAVAQELAKRRNIDNPSDLIDDARRILNWRSVRGAGRRLLRGQ